MSLKGLKKRLGRSAQSVRQSLGRCDVTVDKEYDDMEMHFLGLLADVRKTADGISHFSKALARLAPLHDDLGAIEELMQETGEENTTGYQDASNKMKGQTSITARDLMEGAHQQCQEYIDKFKTLQDFILERKKRVLDYDRARHLHQSANPEKVEPSKRAVLAAQLDTAQQRYEEVNAAIKADFQLFFDDAANESTLIFNALLKAQVEYHKACLEALAGVAEGDIGELTFMATANAINFASSSVNNEAEDENKPPPTPLRSRAPPPSMRPPVPETTMSNDVEGSKAKPPESVPEKDKKAPGVATAPNRDWTTEDDIAFTEAEYETKRTATHVALFTYEARQEGDLGFQAGDYIFILDTSDPGWWVGRLRGQIGVIPSNYVEAIVPTRARKDSEVLIEFDEDDSEEVVDETPQDLQSADLTMSTAQSGRF